MRKETDEAAAKAVKEAKEAKETAAAAKAEDVWSKEQQAQLEEGMKEFKADVEVKERWISIATKVDGKNPKQCFERFKDLCAKAKNK